jgi:deoxyadenosine/deoxycytidine kinase
MIIALSGKAGSGKDTVANELVKSKGFIKVAFADPIKRMAMEMFDFSREQLWGESNKRDKLDTRYGFSPRYVLQKMATDFGRNLFEDVWVNTTKHVIDKLNNTISTYSPYSGVNVIYTPQECEKLNSEKNIIITDCRFVNELNFIKKQNWPIYRVKRDSEKHLDHISETDLDNILDTSFTKVIINNNIEDMRQQLNVLFE